MNHQLLTQTDKVRDAILIGLEALTNEEYVRMLVMAMRAAKSLETAIEAEIKAVTK